MSIPAPPADPSCLAPRPDSHGSRRWRAVIAILLSTCLGLLGLEFAARWHALKGAPAAMESMFGFTWSNGAGEVPRVVPEAELGFWRNPLHPKINSLGLLGDEQMLGPRNSQRLRVLVIGDSVAYPPEGFVHQFEKVVQSLCAQPVEVINGAVHGYTTYQERMYLERILPSLDLDLVLLQYCLNDNYDFLHQITKSGNMLLTLEAKSHLFPEDGGFLSSLTRSSYLVYGIRKSLYQRSQAADTDPWDDRVFGSAWRAVTWEREREHFTAIKSLLADRQVKFAVIAVPHEGQLSAERIRVHGQKVAYPQTQLRSICAWLGTPLLDLLDPFVAAADRNLYTDGIHFSEAGHQLASEHLVEFIRKQQLLPLK